MMNMYLRRHCERKVLRASVFDVLQNQVPMSGKEKRV
jgi:hypothetical protein